MCKRISCFILILVLGFLLSFSISPNEYYIINAEDTFENMSTEEVEFYSRQSDSISQYQALLSSFNEACKMRNSAEQVYDENYGGAYIDENGELVVLLVNQSAEKNEQVRDITGNSELLILECKYSFNELMNVIDTVNANLEYFLGKGIIISSMYEDVYKNSVYIDVIDLNEEKELIIREVVNSPCMRINNCAEYARNDEAISIKGGVSINSEDGGWSTLGFCASSQDGNGFVIAGHAGDVVGEKFYHAETYIGEVTQTAYYSGSTADAAFVVKSSNVETTNVVGAFKCRYRATSIADYPVGATITKLGATTGTTSGTILSNHFTVTTTGGYFLGQVKTSYDSEGGDSGGPVYIAADVVNGNITCKLLGIHKGSSSTYAFFSKLTNIEEVLDIQVLTYCTIVKRVDTFFKEKYLRTVA